MIEPFEPDFGPEHPPRFDHLPLKLEHRGTTQQETTQQPVSKLELHQQLLWSKQTIHKNSTAAKLRSIGRHVEAALLEKCHTQFTICVCNRCKKVQKFPNRCDTFFCAECQPRLSWDRKRAVEWWLKEINQPKFVTLTVKNLPEMNRFHVLEFKRWFRNLLRRKFARNWTGGFYSLEVTNEGRGWHLHLHAMINAHWIDEFELSAQWESVTNGMGRIVKVKDARQFDYLHQVTKYAVKGNDLAAWQPDQIATFIDAFTGLRTFGVFGELHGKRTQFAEWFKAVRDSKSKCPCGCDDVLYFTESQFLEMDLRPATNTLTIPPPKAIDHPELRLEVATNWTP